MKVIDMNVNFQMILNLGYSKHSKRTGHHSPIRARNLEGRIEEAERIVSRSWGRVEWVKTEVERIARSH